MEKLSDDWDDRDDGMLSQRPSLLFQYGGRKHRVNTSLVVEEVQKYPVIYNKFAKDYKTKFIRMNIWKAMERNSGWTRPKKLCSHVTVFAVNKSCWYS